LAIGKEGRLFAAHEDVLCQSPYFEALCQDQYLEAQSKRIALPEEEPEVFSGVLEYLYKGDYYPRLLHNKHRNSWELEDSDPRQRHTPHSSPNPNENGGGRAGSSSAQSSPYIPSAVEATVYISAVGQHLLDAIVAWLGPHEDFDALLSRFISDNELAWLNGTIPPEFW
jgi:hypothetical protein